MKYKLLVLDVDGTLLNDAKEISKRTLASLLKAQQMGVRIALASGRPTYGLMPLAKTLELGHYGGFIVSYNGCQIINAQKRRNPVREANQPGNAALSGKEGAQEWLRPIHLS